MANAKIDYQLPSLAEQWGNKEIWLRTLYVRCALIWVFRDEFIDLNLGTLRSLASILADAYLISVSEASRPCDNGTAFDGAIGLIRQQIDNRVAMMGLDAELERLKKLVDEARACDPLQQIFRRLAKNTKDVYGDVPFRKVILDREWLRDHPTGAPGRDGRYGDAYHVNAQTTIRGSVAHVELQVHLDDFDWFSLLAVPALLTHELVCHAHAREDRNNERSLWAEGVMDWVASYFFDGWAGQLGLPSSITKLHGRHLWEDRMSPWRQTGRFAADAVVDWLMKDRTIREASVAQPLTSKLAMQINVVDAPLPSKDVLASRLLNIRHDRALQRAIRAWHHDSQPVATLLAAS